jgi:pyrimidine operon attenuation protein/uracil phosphoribosyltransferase
MKKVIDSREFKRILEKISSSFFLENKGMGRKSGASPCIVGIQTRGVYLGKRIAELLKKKHRLAPAVGSLDITLYRDDVGEIGKQPLVKETHIPFEVEGKTILLVDDVLYTGRTIRAALDALLELGRPRLIRLAVVVDRAGRELPIRADYCGAKMTVGNKEEVQLKIKEVDGEDGVWVIKKGGAGETEP